MFETASSVMHNFIWVSSTTLIKKETNDPVPKKYLDRRKDRQKDRPILFYRTFLATASGPTSATAVDWH